MGSHIYYPVQGNAHLSTEGGGVGVLESGKLATSRLTDRERIDPKVWSGERLAPTDGTMPLLKHTKTAQITT